MVSVGVNNPWLLTGSVGYSGIYGEIEADFGEFPRIVVCSLAVLYFAGTHPTCASH